jgi:ribosomal protein L15
VAIRPLQNQSTKFSFSANTKNQHLFSSTARNPHKIKFEKKNNNQPTQNLTPNRSTSNPKRSPNSKYSTSNQNQQQNLTQQKSSPHLLSATENHLKQTQSYKKLTQHQT